MIRQKSFQNEMPTLFLVPTPIGNLDEMTPRAIEVLKSVDVIACEDTRTSGNLLKHFDISKRLIAYQNFNEEASAHGIVHLLEQGQNVALISDAGYPLISDPGQRVVKEASIAGFNVVPISGCNAALNALVASGLIAQPYLFIGFLPSGHTDRVKKLKEYKNYPMTMVFYEAPHRIDKTLQDMLDVLGDRQACIAREITKIHEEFLRGTIKSIIEEKGELKGEMVVVVEGCRDEREKDIDMGTIMNMVNDSIEAGLSTRDAIKEVAGKTGLSKNYIYDVFFNKEKGVN